MARGQTPGGASADACPSLPAARPTCLQRLPQLPRSVGSSRLAVEALGVQAVHLHVFQKLLQHDGHRGLVTGQAVHAHAKVARLSARLALQSTGWGDWGCQAFPATCPDPARPAGPTAPLQVPPSLLLCPLLHSCCGRQARGQLDGSLQAAPRSRTFLGRGSSLALQPPNKWTLTLAARPALRTPCPSARPGLSQGPRG